MAQRPTNASQSPDQSATNGFRPVGGLIYGIIAFVVSFIVTTAYFFYRVNESTNGNIGRLLPEEPKALGWPFYNAHRIDIAFSPGSESINYIESFEPLNMLVFNAILAVVLFLAGYSVATRTNAALSDEASFVAGASVAVGYVPLSTDRATGARAACPAAGTARGCGTPVAPGWCCRTDRGCHARTSS